MITGEYLEEVRQLARRAIESRRLDSAQVLLDGLCAYDSFDRWSARTRFEVALARGDASRALHASEAWLSISPRDPLASRAKARALLSLGRTDEGADWMKEAARRGDHIAAAWTRCQTR